MAIVANNNGKDELSKFIKEAYDEFNSGFNKEKQDQEKEYGKLHYLCKGYKCPGTIHDLKKQIAEIGLTNIENPADGDCFYYSIETYLKLIGLNEFNHLNLRKMVADELLGENIELYASYIIADDPVKFLKDHEKDIRTPREWNNYLGELPSMILPKLLGYNLKIYTLSIQSKRKKDKEGVNVKNKYGEVIFVPEYKYFSESSINIEGEPKGTMYILNTGNHYEALIPTDLLEIPEVKDRISKILSEQFKYNKANIKKNNKKNTIKKVMKVKKVTIKNNSKSNSNNEKLIMNFNNWEKLTRPNISNTPNISNIKSNKPRTRKSTRLSAKGSKIKNELLMAARAGPSSSSESNNNSKLSISKSKKKLTKKQQKEYNSWKNQGMNSNTAFSLVTTK
jgi:hypothetical protein